MSNYLAIATVTATLQRSLQATVQVDVEGARVTTVRPDSLGGGSPETGVNLYLYNASPNPAWRNADLRTRFSEGQIAKRPQAALDLYYLLSCYGNEIELEPQRLLGSVIRTLHARAYLTRDMILDTVSDPAYEFLANSNLADQVESVKLMPMNISTEELSSIWSVFFQTPHAISIVYHASVILIESDDIPQRALPVRDRHFLIAPNQPVIDRVLAVERQQVITVNNTLLIRGQRLDSRDAQVRIGQAKVTPPKINASEIVIPLADIPRELLRAGVQSVQVIHPKVQGNPPVRHRGLESNVAAFVLRPIVIEVQLTNLEEDDSDARSADIVVTTDLTIGRGQRVILHLNERSLETPASYSFESSPCAADTHTVSISVSDVKPGDYLVRLQIDGAESLLEVDTAADSPTAGQYINPRVLIP
ncbi:MAG TPA: DUF4255 domain-containing protein [Crinalium sp.]|jgi:hypothetical protein